MFRKMTTQKFLATVLLTGLSLTQAQAETGFQKYTYTEGALVKDIGAVSGNNYEDFSGVAFHPVSKTVLVPDVLDDVLLELGTGETPEQPAGARLNVISLAPLRDASETLNPSAMTWVSGNIYAIVLKGKNQLVLADIVPGTTVDKSKAKFYALPSSGADSIEAVAYRPSDNVFFLINSSGDMTVFKVQLNDANGTLTILDSFSAVSVGVSRISDALFDARISPHLLFLTAGPGGQEVSVKEVVVAEGQPSVKGTVLSSFAFNYSRVPVPGGLGIDKLGRLYIVGSKTSAVRGEFDFARFDPTPAVTELDQPLVVSAVVPPSVVADGLGQGVINVDASATHDPEGDAISWFDWYEGDTWLGDSTVPTATLTLMPGLGTHTIRLEAHTADGEVGKADFVVEVVAFNAPPLAAAQVNWRVVVNEEGVGQLSVDASASSDPENDLITRYVWKEGDTVLSDTTSALATFSLSNLGWHSLTLTVTSKDSNGISQSASTNFSTELVNNSPPVPVGNLPFEFRVEQGQTMVQISADASGSYDADGDTIIKYEWAEGDQILYSGNLPTTQFQLNGTGLHTLTLTVTSQSGSQQLSSMGTYSVNVLPALENQKIGSTSYVRMAGGDFANNVFAFEDFSGLTYSPVTQTLFSVDSKLNYIIETSTEGSILRSISIGGLLNAEEDAEGIAWMHDRTFAVELEEPGKIAVISIEDQATSIEPSNATFYDLPSEVVGQLESLAYLASEHAFYFVKQKNPIKIFKGVIQAGSSSLTVESFEVQAPFPATDITDIAFAPLVTPHLLVLSEESAKIIEVAIVDTPQGQHRGNVIREFNPIASPWNIPKLQGMAFDDLGRLYLVGENVRGRPEDNFSRFDPTTPIGNPTNHPPIASAVVPANVTADENDLAQVHVNALASSDPDSGDVITEYKWTE